MRAKLLLVGLVVVSAGCAATRPESRLPTESTFGGPPGASEPVLRSASPDTTPPADEAEQTPFPARVLPDAMPDGLDAALMGARFVVESDDGGWIVADYAGHSAKVDLPDSVSFDVHGRWITAVATVDGSWRVYGVAADGQTTRLVTLPATQPNVLATRSLDGARVFVNRRASNVDGGVLSIDLASGKVDQLVPSSSTPGATRRLLTWSTSQRSLFSSVCALYVCDEDMIDAATGKVRRLPKHFGVVAASDDYALGYSSAEGPDRPWELYDLNGDKKTTVARKWIAETDEGISVGDDRFAIAGWSADLDAYNIVLVDASTGDSRLVLSQPASENIQRLRRYLTGSKWVILGHDDLTLEQRDGAQSDILDVETGQIYRAVARVSLPESTSG